MHEGIHITLKAEAVAHVFGVPITNTMLMSWLAAILLIVIGVYVGRNLVKIPGKLQTFFETFFSFLLDYIEEVLGSRQFALRFFPLLATLFMFILLGNWLGLMPGIGPIYITKQPAHVAETVPYDPLFVGAKVHNGPVIEEHRIELFHPMSTDLNVTLALALISFVVIEFSGFFFLGFRYLGKFFNFKSPITFFVGIIELISEFARLVSFSFRLFGNMFAGKTMILIAMFFLPLLLPVPFMVYEVLVGFIQAGIFTILTLFFVKLAVSKAH